MLNPNCTSKDSLLAMIAIIEVFAISSLKVLINLQM